MSEEVLILKRRQKTVSSYRNSENGQEQISSESVPWPSGESAGFFRLILGP